VSVTEENGAAIQVPGTSSYLSFDNSPDYVRPVWPADEGRQRMMMHIDIAVDDLAAAVSDALELGAALADFQPQENVRVLPRPGRPPVLPLPRRLGHPQFAHHPQLVGVPALRLPLRRFEPHAGRLAGG
jgi:hypothetical protein